MPSLKARFFIFLLKHRHWFRGQWRRPTVGAHTSIPDLRRKADQTAGRLGKLPTGIEVESAAIGGFHAEWLRPAPPADDRVILYFHGGGYVMGSAASHRGLVAKVVVGSGLPALLFDYRLAPEHPYPAALEDALAAYDWLLDQGIPAHRILFTGDSAGGGLALATLLALRDRNRSLPAAAAVLSPWTDLKCTGASYQRPDPLAPEGSWTFFSGHYVGEQDAGQLYISPLYGDLTGLPPLLIYAGGDESMLDDSTSFANKARRAGVDVTLRVGEGMVHCYPLMAPLFPEATVAMAEICAFLASHGKEDAKPGLQARATASSS